MTLVTRSIHPLCKTTAKQKIAIWNGPLLLVINNKESLPNSSEGLFTSAARFSAFSNALLELDARGRLLVRLLRHFPGGILLVLLDVLDLKLELFNGMDGAGYTSALDCFVDEAFTAFQALGFEYKALKPV